MHPEPARRLDVLAFVVQEHARSGWGMQALAREKKDLRIRLAKANRARFHYDVEELVQGEQLPPRVGQHIHVVRQQSQREPLAAQLADAVEDDLANAEGIGGA